MRIYTIQLILVFAFMFTSLYGREANPDKKKPDETAQITAPVYPEGIVYTLPRNGFVVRVKAKKTSYKPGPYYQFAQKYLGIENVSGKEKVTWKLTAVEVDQFSEADPDAMFKIVDTLAVPVSLLPDGRIDNIGGESAPMPLVSMVGSDFIVKDDPITNLFKDLSSDDFYELLVDSESGSESMAFKSLEVKAKEAADYIIKLRKKRAYTIIDPSNTIPEDGKGYEVFVNEARRLDEEYMSLFVGKQFSTEQEFSFIFVPGSSNVKNEVLFRFSEEKGILPKTDLSGKPILLAVTKENTAYSSAEKLKASEHPDAGKSGILYRIPVGATVVVSDGLQTLYSGQTVVAQFGVVAPVPENLLNGTYEIQYNTETGSIKNIKEIK